jgi:thiamine biosynthesis lipoprotein
MGTVISVSVYGGEDEVLLMIGDELQKIENASSYTVDTSSVNLLNAQGESTDKYLIEQVTVAQDVFEKSNGAYSHALGELIALWNIGFDGARIPDSDELADAVKNAKETCTHIKDGKLVLEGNGKVHLGSITKGYALDKVKEILKKENVSGATVSVGGSVMFYGKHPEKEYWTCAIRDPFNESGYIGTFKIKEGCVSTSGTYERYFEEDGTRYHHILDAKNGYPAETGLESVTVICENGALSDALSTACFVLGMEEGKQLLSKYGAKGVFIEENGNISVWGDITLEKY